MSLSNTSTASAGSARGASNASPAKDKQLMRLVIQLLRPYRGWLLIAAHSRTPSSTVTAILPQRQDRHADASSPLKILRAQDTVIIERLVRAVNRGVSVHIMARPAHKMKANKLVEGVGGLHIMDDVGAKIYTLKHLKLHGKMLLADEKRAIVGTINLTPGSFDARRELAIETTSRHVVKRLVEISHRDWKHSRKLDLSDEGLLADFEKHGAKGADKLAIPTRSSGRTTE